MTFLDFSDIALVQPKLILLTICATKVTFASRGPKEVHHLTKQKTAVVHPDSTVPEVFKYFIFNIHFCVKLILCFLFV